MDGVVESAAAECEEVSEAEEREEARSSVILPGSLESTPLSLLPSLAEVWPAPACCCGCWSMSMSSAVSAVRCSVRPSMLDCSVVSAVAAEDGESVVAGNRLASLEPSWSCCAEGEEAEEDEEQEEAGLEEAEVAAGACCLSVLVSLTCSIAAVDGVGPSRYNKLIRRGWQCCKAATTEKSQVTGHSTAKE